jgi:hypothetical protein
LNKRLKKRLNPYIKYTRVPLKAKYIDECPICGKKEGVTCSASSWGHQRYEEEEQDTIITHEKIN